MGACPVPALVGTGRTLPHAPHLLNRFPIVFQSPLLSAPLKWLLPVFISTAVRTPGKWGVGSGRSREERESEPSMQTAGRVAHGESLGDWHAELPWPLVKFQLGLKRIR